MISGLKPYPAYKESGEPWLGRVPAHWDIRRLKYILREVDDRSTWGTEQLLRVSQYTGVTERENLNDEGEPDTRAASLVGYKLVKRSELAVNIMLAWNGSLGVSHFDGIVSPAYCVYRFRPGVLPEFFHSLLRSSTYKARIKTASRGVVESRLRLYTDDLFCIEALSPPLDEQAAIVRFILYAERKIRQSIAAKKRLIALLNEEKQTIIHRAVTRGLDPNAPVRPSGVDWLGDIPEHWEVKPAKFYFREVDERSRAGGEDLLSVSHKTGVTLRSEKNITMFMAESYVGHKLCRPDDVVVNTMWGWMAAVGVSPRVGIVSPSYGVYRLKRQDSFRPAFLDLLLRTEVYRGEYLRSSRGITASRLRLYPEQFMRIPFLHPPLIDQDAILRNIGLSAATLSTASATAQREIDLLNEYRTRLISDVVTGKLDVRAAAVPDEIEDEAPLDADEELVGEDALAEDVALEDADA